jgi:hypothetical protein
MLEDSIHVKKDADFFAFLSGPFTDNFLCEKFAEPPAAPCSLVDDKYIYFVPMSFKTLRSPLPPTSSPRSFPDLIYHLHIISPSVPPHPASYPFRIPLPKKGMGE